MKIAHTVKKDTVSMTKRSFEALMAYVEDMEDALAFDRASENDEESFPGEVVKRLIDKENPVLVYREYRGLTQDKLAKAVGVSKGMISKIESGNKIGSLETLKKIATALTVDLDDIC